VQRDEQHAERVAEAEAARLDAIMKTFPAVDRPITA